MRPRLHLVDVFAPRRYAGNPLAVVLHDTPLPRARMQAIAREINFSETTFLAPRPGPDGQHRVRIFTPSQEIAFAGHAVLGTAAVVRPPRARNLSLQLAVDRLPVHFGPRAGQPGMVWFRAPPISMGPLVPAALLATLLGLPETVFDPAVPIRQWGAGTQAVLARLRDGSVLDRLRPDERLPAGLRAAGLPPLLYLYCEQQELPRRLRARFFFEANGLREDPATGNAASFLGAQWLAEGFVPNEGMHLVIDQGANLGRPSQVHVWISRSISGEARIEVGGRVIPTASGVLL
jgi:trans-2,3-dihydro-3-hydroxyanthranilate isomerase